MQQYFEGQRSLYLELLHLQAKMPLTREEMAPYNFRNIASTFLKCFKVDQSLDDHGVLSRYVHGPAFDGFLVCQTVKEASGVEARNVIGTLSLCLKTISGNRKVVYVYNLCIEPTLQGKANGKNFMDKALECLYASEKIVASDQTPVMIALSIIFQSPTYLMACKSYTKQGFFSYGYGNVAEMTDYAMSKKFDELMNIPLKSQNMTIARRDFDVTNGVISSENRRKTFTFGENRYLALFKLDKTGNGDIDFAFPPNDFCEVIYNGVMNPVTQSSFMPSYFNSPKNDLLNSVSEDFLLSDDPEL